MVKKGDVGFLRLSFCLFRVGLRAALVEGRFASVYGALLLFSLLARVWVVGCSLCSFLWEGLNALFVILLGA
jgi:hypothetical protein